MGRRVASVVVALTLPWTGACQTGADPAGTDTAHLAVSLPAAYRDLPAAPPGTPVESGPRVGLDARQQEVIVTAVGKLMKYPGTAQYGSMTAARNRFGVVTVCGTVNGRNGAGTYTGLQPYIGVLLGPPARPEFVVVGIGGTARERADVTSLCREAGATT